MTSGELSEPEADGSTLFSPDAENTTLHPGPLEGRGGHSAVWTGAELVVWGGWGDEVGAVTFADGAAYDPRTDRWRLIADAPLSPRHEHIAAWTGTEMLIVAGDGRRDGAAYDPMADEWRLLPAVPLPTAKPPTPRQSPHIAWTWTGSELVVWNVVTDQVAAYAPETDRWRALPPVGLGADGGVLRSDGKDVLALGTQDIYPRSVPLLAARLIPEATGWEPLPEAQLWTANLNADASPELTAWAGGRLVAWTDSGQDARTQAFEPATGVWADIAPIPLDGCEARPEPVVLDDRILAFGGCGDSAIYDPGTGAWTQVRLDAPGDGRHAVWTGDEVLSWGATCCYGTGDARAFTVQPWRYVPPGS